MRDQVAISLRNGGVWTDEKTELCRRLYIEEGRSAGYTAKVLGPRFTRNMVIGKGRRSGWSRSSETGRLNMVANAKEQTKARQARGGARTALGRRVQTLKTPGPAGLPKDAAPLPLDDAPPETAKPLTERQWRECAWPYQVNGEWLCCCRPVPHESRSWAYCASHAKRMFRKSPRPMEEMDLRRFNGFHGERAA